jgi:hypothetical protein
MCSCSRGKYGKKKVWHKHDKFLKIEKRLLCFWIVFCMINKNRGKGGADMEKMQFVCPKCGCHEFVQDQFQATGGTMAKLFDIQNKKFITISCEKCGYTEIYRAETSTGANILDFLIGS